MNSVLAGEAVASGDDPALRASASAASQGKLEQGLRALRAGDYPLAIACITAAIQQDPGQPRAFLYLGKALLAVGDVLRAQKSFAQALVLSPGFGAAHAGLGEALGQLGAFDAAVEAFDRALQVLPRLDDEERARVLLLSGNAEGALGNAAAALHLFDASLSLAPDTAAALFGRGNACRSLGNLQAACSSFEQALAIDPMHVPALLLCGLSLLDLQEYQSAREYLTRALSLAPHLPDVHFGLGQIMTAVGDIAGAHRAYGEALCLDEKHSASLIGLMNCQLVSGAPDLAFASLLRLEEMRVKADHLPGVRVLLNQQLCNWPVNLDELRELAAEKGGRGGVTPFTSLLLFDDPALQYRLAADFMAENFPPCAFEPMQFPVLTRRSDKLRIGYFSSDYFNHATAYLMAGLFEHHDRTRVEVVAFSFGGASGDEMRLRIEKGCDEFVDVTFMSDREIAALSRDKGIHIAIDLKGLTYGARPGIFAHRAAPIQVNYLGYPGSMASPNYDYLIADEMVVNSALRPHISESVIFMPGCYQVNDGRREFAPQTFSRAECGLPVNGFVFCCFSKHFKITQAVFSAWMRILLGVPGSVLWLLDGSSVTRENLRLEARRCGVSPDRLVFAPLMAQNRHLARLRLAGLSLDTLPYNAHTTASDALWAGVPHLTCHGRGFAARVAASLLQAVGVPELIVPDWVSFEHAAIAIGLDPAYQRALVDKLENHKHRFPLFDTVGFARDIECAYRQIWTIYQRGGAATDLKIASLKPVTGSV